MMQRLMDIAGLLGVRIAEREREKKKKSGGLPDCDTYSKLTRTTKPNAALRPIEAEKGVRGSSPTTIQHNTPRRKTIQAQWIRRIPATSMQHNTPRSDNESDFKSLRMFRYEFSTK
jgi:hypothetical protein